MIRKLFNNFGKDKTEENQTEQISYTVDEIKEITPEDEWIWVEGYKGTDKNMCCRDFQYSMNKIFIHNDEEEPIELCESGFHLCLELEHCFDYYDITDENIFFRVKALVKKKDLNNLEELKKDDYTHYSMWDFYNKDSKIVAKEIEFIEEIKYSDIRIINYIKRNYSWIETDNEVENIINNKEYDHIKFLNEKFTLKMKELKFSDTYIIIKSNELNIDNLQKFYEKAKALSDEKISKDMLIYLLEGEK